MVVIVIVSLFRGKKNKEDSAKPVDTGTRPVDNKPSGSPFNKLLDSSSQISGQIQDAANGLEKLRFDLQDFSATNWNQMKAVESKYYRLADNIFLLLDYLEDFTKQETKSEETEWIYQKTLRIIHDENIAEIKLAVGDKFDPNRHNNVKSRESDMPAGSVVEILRKGYYTKGQSGKEIILRHADVVVSQGMNK